jgi:hypothetical protein
VLQFNQLADIELHFRPELAAVGRNIRNDHAGPCAIAPAGDDIEVSLTAKLPSCSPVDVSHRSSLMRAPRVRVRSFDEGNSRARADSEHRRTTANLEGLACDVSRTVRLAQLEKERRHLMGCTIADARG